MNEIMLLATSIGAGFLGSILGLGGGIIIVPVLTLALNIDIRYAIAASLISIVATSSSSAVTFLKDHLTNLRISALLEVGTVFGAITGFYISSYIESSYLYLLFGFFLIFCMVLVFLKKEDSLSLKDHPWSQKLKLAGTFKNQRREKISYKVEKVPLGLFFMYIAGILSALLGIGSGILKVVSMDGAMKLPMKVSSATSNFMIGVTATASAGAYFIKGDIQPQIVAPVAIGVIIGSALGARLLLKMDAQIIRKIFVVLLLIVSVQMILKGFNL